MKLSISQFLYCLGLSVALSTTQELPLAIWRRDGYGENAGATTLVTSTATFDEIDSTYSIVSTGFLTILTPAASKSDKSDDTVAAELVTAKSESDRLDSATSTEHPSGSNGSATAAGHPTRPANYPTYAAYEEGIVYVKGMPYQILAADSDYYHVEQAGNGEWEVVDKVDAEDINDTEEEHKSKLAGGGSRSGGGAIYSADVPSAAENAVTKAVFFTIIAALMVTVGLLVFFGVIK
ncbi:hypothetical protein ABW20_dc0100943 [Dactylellina cionopaga]|nr:hypothetical protein ABW20_dc0100943 [Dactylellina cionopaga]